MNKQAVMNYELHPLCTLFPRMAGAEFKALCDDLAVNGLRTPITLHNGMILDGGNRYRACLEAGIEPAFTEFDGSSLVQFVLSANLHRRHLSAGQQAAIVASAQDWANAQTRGGDRKSDQSATLHFDTADKRAAESGASLRTQKMADKVAKADPVLSRQVAHGEVSLPKAVAQVEERAGKAAKPNIKTTPARATSEVESDAVPADQRDAQISELTRELTEALADNTRIGEVFDADDKLAAAMAANAALAEEVKQLKALLKTASERVSGLVFEKSEMNAELQKLQRQVARLKKAAEPA